MKINKYCSQLTDYDYSVYQMLIKTYLTHAKKNNVKHHTMRRSITDLLQMMSRNVANNSYIEHFSCRYWTHMALYETDFDLNIKQNIENVNNMIFDFAATKKLPISTKSKAYVLDYAVPISIVNKAIIKLFEQKKEFIDFIKANYIVVNSTKIEDYYITKAGYSTTMPSADIWARYKVCNIPVYDTLTAERVC